jgi:hypothetical protein
MRKRIPPVTVQSHQFARRIEPGEQPESRRMKLGARTKAIG